MIYKNMLIRVIKKHISWFNCCFVLLCLCSANAYAHKPSDSYLQMAVQENTITGQWDIALRDLDFAIGLDENGDHAITWQEVVNKQKEIHAYAFARLNIQHKKADCHIKYGQTLIDHHTDGNYAVLQFTANCNDQINQLTVRYSLFADLDPSHRGLLKLDYKGTTITTVKTAIFGPDNALQSFILEKSSRFTEFKEYVTEGIWHIWTGYDHILFLISLLLPAVLVYQHKEWRAAPHFKAPFFDILKVVTAFTLAHSITLTLATLHVVSLPSRWVESVIALSIILAALNNLYPYILGRRWLVAFIFGLIHGFGFAAVLADLGLTDSTLVIALIGFNIGVEIGQLCIVIAFVPLAYSLRHSKFYQHTVIYGGSILVVLIASAWFIERAFNQPLFSQLPNFLTFFGLRS